MLAVASQLIITLGNLGNDMADLLAPAELAASSVNAIVSIIRPALDGLAAFADFVHTEDLEAKLVIFSADLMAMVIALADAITEMSRKTRGAVDRASGAAADINSIISVIVPSIEALKALSEFAVADIGTKITDILAQVGVIIVALVDMFDYSRKGGGVPASIVENAIKFSEAMAITMANVASAVASMNALLQEDTPEGLVGILQQLQDIMFSIVIPVYNIGLEIGQSFMKGITDGITAGFDTLSMVMDTLVGLLGGGVIEASVGGDGGGATMGDNVGGLTTNLNIGGMTFNTTINDQMTQDEFEFRVATVVQGWVS